MKAKLFSSALSILTALAMLTFHPSSARAADPIKEAMQLKLGYAQKVLEGVAMEDYDLILQNSQKLKKLSQAGGWYSRQTPEYDLLMNEFRRQAESLERAAKQKNLDAATGAYFQMTVSCVSCHKFIRGKNAAASLPGLNGGQTQVAGRAVNGP